MEIHDHRQLLACLGPHGTEDVCGQAVFPPVIPVEGASNASISRSASMNSNNNSNNNSHDNMNKGSTEDHIERHLSCARNSRPALAWQSASRPSAGAHRGRPGRPPVDAGSQHRHGSCPAEFPGARRRWAPVEQAERRLSDAPMPAGRPPASVQRGQTGAGVAARTRTQPKLTQTQTRTRNMRPPRRLRPGRLPAQAGRALFWPGAGWKTWRRR